MSMEIKKVIEQERDESLIIWTFDNEIKICNIDSESSYIEKSKAREVALVICPNLQSELEKAKELLKRAVDCRGLVYSNEKLESDIIDFLEGSGNKTK